MAFSKLVNNILLTNNCTKPRNHVVDTQTPHYMACYATALQCCNSFVPSSRRASANYCIGYLGDIAGNVDEINRAWTTGSSSNDHRAITFECACYMDGVNKGVLPDATWKSLVNLSAEICLRYKRPELVYTGSLSYATLKSNQMLLTKHKWFQNTDCPGPWLDKQFERLAREVNAITKSGKITPVTPSFSVAGLYICNVATLNVRDAPTIKDSNVVAEYKRGQYVQLDDWYTSKDGYIWGCYTGGTSGKKRYVAIGRDTGKPEKDDFLLRGAV